MSEAKITVDAGVCRFKTSIHAVGTDDFMTVNLVFSSDCPNIQKLAETMRTVDAIDAVSTAIIDNAVMKECSKFIPHPACPIPSAIVKACEVAADLGLKKDVVFKFE
ncbi:MAG: hypothetical protein LBI08_02775 [Methanomassiliicoccaceae archaeon]|nr:hypothetical protein [Methanomassiliicoccaceae archaeon]